MPDLTACALIARRVVGDRVVLDYLEVARMGLYGEQGGGRVRTAHLMERWGVSQPTVSRRLAAINSAPPWTPTPHTRRELRNIAAELEGGHG